MRFWGLEFGSKFHLIRQVFIRTLVQESKRPYYHIYIPLLCFIAKSIVSYWSKRSNLQFFKNFSLLTPFYHLLVSLRLISDLSAVCFVLLILNRSFKFDPLLFVSPGTFLTFLKIRLLTLIFTSLALNYTQWVSHSCQITSLSSLHEFLVCSLIPKYPF